jgi:hypothetical protein
MISKFEAFAVVSLSLAAVLVQTAKSQDHPAVASRTPPVEATPQIVLDLYAVEMSGQTLRQLGLAPQGGKQLGGPFVDSPLLENSTAWNAALETAVRLGRAQVISAPTIATVSGREADMEVLGVEFNDEGSQKPGAAKVSIQWTMKPTLMGGDKVRLVGRFSRSETDITRELDTPNGPPPAVRLQQIPVGVEIALGKPTVLIRAVRNTSKLASDEKSSRGSKKAAANSQETAMLIVATASLADAKGGAIPKGARR